MYADLALWDLDDTLYTGRGQHLEARQGIGNVLSRTRNGVVTFQRTEEAIRIMETLGILPHFEQDLIYGCEPPVTVESKIPLVRAAIESTGVHPRKTIVVGDQYADVLAARSNGTIAVYLNVDPTEAALMRRHKGIEPDLVVEPENLIHLHEILDQVAQ